MSTVPTNPADCDRTTVYTGECRNYSDTAWVPFQSGRRRAPDAPDYQWLVDSGTGSFWMRDDQVRNLVRLVPASPVTAEADVDRWRRAHEMVERERDQARESLRRLRDETDFDLFTVRDQLKQCRGEREQMTRDRDEWKARAEQAERERDEWQASADKWHGRWQQAAPIRDVSRAGIENQLRIAYESGNHPIQRIRIATDAVCDLFGVEAEQAVDPVEEKARELYRAATPDARWETVADEYRRIAAHVLGQEADQ